MLEHAACLFLLGSAPSAVGLQKRTHMHNQTLNIKYQLECEMCTLDKTNQYFRKAFMFCIIAVNGNTWTYLLRSEETDSGTGTFKF